MPTAIITGASRGLGAALARTLAARGWRLVIDARGAAQLTAVAADCGDAARAVPGDVTDPAHRTALIAAARRLGGVDLLVNNASMLGPSPQPPLADYPTDVLADVLAVDVVAPLALVREAMPDLRAAGGTVVNISSDAAVEAYPGWGGYGSAKAALDRASAVLAAEEPGLRVLAVDPGDMNTAMHAAAFPGEDLSGLPAPEDVVDRLVACLDRPSGRYRLADLAPAAVR